MFAIAIALINGALVALVCLKFADFQPVWAFSCGMLGFLLTHICIALIIRRKINQIQAVLQAEMTNGQQQVNRKVHQLQMKPSGNMKSMQKLLEKEQFKSLRNALEIIKEMDKYTSWSPLLNKQLSAMRLQFYYQLKEFDKVDEYIPKALFLDANLVAMKMARMYHHKDPKLDSFFKSKIKKFSGDNAVLIYGLYSWILVKQDRIDDAIKILVEGKDKTDNEVLKRNWESLVNGKVKRFSNAGIGEIWYSLYLEEPKVQKPKMQRQGKGFR